MADSAPSSLDLFKSDGQLQLEAFTGDAAKALRAALHVAKDTQWNSLRSPHVFMGLLREPDADLQEWARRAETDLRALLFQFEELFREPEQEPETLLALHREFFSDNLLRRLREAQQRALRQGHPRITSLDLLLTILTASPSVVAECIQSQGISPIRLAEVARAVEQDRDKKSPA